MASIVLSAVGTSVGAAVGGPIGMAFGSQLGRAAGGFVDGTLFGRGRTSSREGARLQDLAVQGSSYGQSIPIAYGTMRLAGNVIWARPIKETATSTTQSAGGKGGGKVKQTSTEYSYTATLAIGICEGPIDEILRVWADAKQLDLSQGHYRIYKGDETQLPDALIESFEGIGYTPAYRGLAYVVIEDFPLEAFGNRIPNFTFEIRKKALWPDFEGESVERMVTSMVLIPGSGEFVCDTQQAVKITGESVAGNFVQRGERVSMNQHTPYGKANALVAMDQLQDTCPNVEWVSVVVNWFGTSMDASSCTVVPGVEFNTEAIIDPQPWGVAGQTRSTAHLITYENGSPRYGGTPDDASLIRCIDELRERGYKVMLYPLFLMDVDGKPWRGRVTGTPGDVANFFTKPNGYNGFVTHYANLLAGRLDGFAIGSELKGLTAVKDSSNNFPAVSALVSLAASVKAVLGSEVTVTYAADWSEYHHTDGGWYQLDPLWASPNIDVVGIDAYFPITAESQETLGYGVAPVMQGWDEGEDYDFYYSDSERTVQAPLAPAYAAKNIAWWWSNSHINPDGATTAWVPESKKIWFTEFGFPSVDGATNQPNVFYDPTSTESFFPRQSRGRIDFRAQRAGIAGTLARWKNSEMVERLFLWTWDLRPYPYWPDLTSVWADGGNWKTGHWVQGKFGLSSLAAIIADLCQRAGLNLGEVDVSRLTQQVEGYVVNEAQTARQAIETLMQAFFVDAVESDGMLRFFPREGFASDVELVEEGLATNGEVLPGVTISRQQEVELPQKVEVLYLNRLADYQTGVQMTQRTATDSREAVRMSLPIVLSDSQARSIADGVLYQAWSARNAVSFDLPPRHAMLEPGDVVTLETAKATLQLRLLGVRQGANGLLRVEAIPHDIGIFDNTAPAAEIVTGTQPVQTIPATRMELLDLPTLPNDDPAQPALRMAGIGVSAGWQGAVVYRSEDSGQSYARLSELTNAATIGTAITALPNGTAQVMDEVSSVTVVLMGQGTLESSEHLALLNGANLALLGNEIIQFAEATEILSGKYILSGLLRGRLGTEWAMDSHSEGERFVLLNAQLRKVPVPAGLIDLPRLYRGVSIGAGFNDGADESFTYRAIGMKPYAPVHITGARDGSGNLAIAWVRRTRSGGEWRDGADVPLGEASERYTIEVLDGTEVVRSWETSLAQASYLATDQTADFGSIQSIVTLRVAQYSELVGRGTETTATV